MSDFLSNLADRSLAAPGQAQVVQPRLPSLFEPWPVRGAVFAGTDPRTSAVVEEIREAPAAPVRRAVSNVEPRAAGMEQRVTATSVRDVARPVEVEPTVARAAAAPRMDARIEPNISPARAPEPPHPVEVRRPIAPSAPAAGQVAPEIPPRVVENAVRAARVPEAALPEPRKQTIPPTSAREAPKSVAPLVREESLEPAVHARRMRPAAIEPAAGEAEPLVRKRETEAPIIRAARVEPVVPARAVASVMPASVQALAAKMAGRSENPRSGAHGARPAAAEPVIHVTIGRIEVRAIPEAPAASKGRAASPVMSLSDYLQKRARRGSA